MESSQPPAEQYPAGATVTSSAPSKSARVSGVPALGNSASLDQWRGLALVLVLISHGFYFTGRVHGIGRVGVNLFFFISGILVFRSLSKERSAPKLAQAGHFWRRRLKRLYPAMATYILAMWPLVLLLQNLRGLPPNSDEAHFRGAIPTALGYLMNYVGGPMSLGHLWSLSCEMQFYMLGPIIFFLGGAAVWRRNLVWGSLLLLLLAAGVSQPLLGGSRPFFGDAHKYHFEFAVWPMMAGFACEYQKAWLERVSRRWARLLFWTCLGLVAAGTAVMLSGLEMKKVVIATGAFVFVPCFLSYVARDSMPGVLGTSLGWLGERTYSIYLWQQPFTICGYLPTLLHPLGSLASILVGGVWFHFFERPFLSSGRRQWMEAAQTATPVARASE